jgi:hypothetical protein
MTPTEPRHFLAALAVASGLLTGCGGGGKPAVTQEQDQHFVHLQLEIGDACINHDTSAVKRASDESATLYKSVDPKSHGFGDTPAPMHRQMAVTISLVRQCDPAEANALVRETGVKEVIR